MAETLRELMRKGKIAGPTVRGFKIGELSGVFGNTVEDEKDSAMLRDAAIAIHGALSEIREELGILYKQHAPQVSDAKLQKYLFALSNRDRLISSEKARNKDFKVKNIFSATTNNNSAENSLTFMEQADGCVDGLQKAIAECSRRISASKPIIPGEQPINVLDFLHREVILSQLYGMFEAYWSALLWGDFDFKWVNEREKIAEIKQRKSNYELAHEISLIRKMRRSIGSIAFVRLAMSVARGAYIRVQGAGLGRKYEVRGIKTASEEIQFMNAKLLILANEVVGAFPRKFINEKQGELKFSILDLMNIFRILSHIAVQLMARFPKDVSITKEVQLAQYSPALDRRKLAKAIGDACAINLDSALEAIEFLTFRKPTDDLWCQPIIDDENGKLTLLTSALITPNLMRVIEHWLVKMGVELTDKGYVFEGDLLHDVNRRLRTNQFAKDCDRGATFRMRIGADEEEVDIIFRLGNFIVVGEAKSIVATDSPISYNRCVATLGRAAEQVKRKTEFVKKNLEAVFQRLNWNWRKDVGYSFVPIVIVSNNMHAGFPVSGIPVCDSAILTAYFEKSRFPLYSTMDENGEKHLAWFEVYSDEKTFCENFSTYISNPPQITEGEDSFVSQSVNIPTFGENSIKLIYTRLIPKEKNLQEIVAANYKFPVRTDPSLEKVISKVDIVI